MTVIRTTLIITNRVCRACPEKKLSFRFFFLSWILDWGMRECSFVLEPGSNVFLYEFVM
jgi:hypothetical protein